MVAITVKPWQWLLVRRLGALVADLGAVLFLSMAGAVLFDAMQIAAFTFSNVIITLFVCFVLLRTFGMSLGHTAFRLSVLPDNPVRHLLRAVVVCIPGINLLDAVSALGDAEHRTWIDRRLGVRVVDATFPFR